ncbi:1-acyl-sn-glycerol-3-phosphate acyltransferase [Spirulina subsalsa FACHB-351]|uniref:1-acyl-sn-glycerol-3-phosphate acyltransferase n=1 Tax=Spirulina subsalsa FACHB-351 TaxID=234711 RepID=A0ABT3L832_9CYAN|nr:1-acyl-sn-glycerol-3-phosphate acyltransferase [Spirulina subsalsa]MCW6037254.1 1-acyl-sn-glycerol-3-phosphate acyltransferase [Spirulina subsalsa FACHB-351]
MPNFYPAQTHPLLTRFVQSLASPVAYGLYRLQVKVSEEDVALLRSLSDQRYILMPNHSNFQDGVVLFLLSARVGQLFNYLVAYDNFRGLLGAFLPRIGAYSIKRGVGDRESILHTLDLLKQPACHMVIFPEGGCSFQNDTVMPFRTGAVQMPLQALNTLAKQGDTLPNFYLIPVSLKYRYTSTMQSTIAESLHQLESTLGIIPPEQDFYPRLRAIGEQVMQNLEREYQITTPPHLDWNQRIEAIKTHVLNYCEQELNIIGSAHLPMREQVYKIQSLLETETQETTAHQKIYRATIRLLNFDAIYDGYVAENPTPERFLDTIIRLEREVFHLDQPPPKGHREVQVKLGNPINLKDYWSAYQEERPRVIEQLTRRVQQVVQDNLSRAC